MFPLSDSDFAVLTIQQKIVANRAERVGPHIESLRHAETSAPSSSIETAGQSQQERPMRAFSFFKRIKRPAGHTLAAEADALR